jgi:predicted membrane channel-forming protein YqfA (hemolysin III family)
MSDFKYTTVPIATGTIRENRFSKVLVADEYELFHDYCRNPRPLWQVIFVNIIMCVVGVVCAQFRVSEDFRIIKTFLWVAIGILSVLYQGCLYPQYKWLGWMDSACVISLMIFNTIVFAPICPWWCWLIASMAIVMFIIYESYRIWDKKLTVQQYTWLLNGWHVLVIITTVCFYASTSESNN